MFQITPARMACVSKLKWNKFVTFLCQLHFVMSFVTSQNAEYRHKEEHREKEYFIQLTVFNHVELFLERNGVDQGYKTNTNERTFGHIKLAQIISYAQELNNLGLIDLLPFRER
jgi:hypothetical protein